MKVLKTSCVGTDCGMSGVYMERFVYKQSLRFPHVTFNNSLSDVLSSVGLNNKKNQAIPMVLIVV